MDWDIIIEDLGPRLYKYFCVRFDKNLADDLTQETLVRLVHKVSTGAFDVLKGSLSVYAFGIAHYVACEARSEFFNNRDLDYVDADDITDSFNIEDSILLKNTVLNVKKHFEFLSVTEQQVMALLVDEDLYLNEIAIILNVPEGTIKSHVYRAKKKLIKLINKENLI